MLKALLIALIAISGTRQDCKAGCLKCDTAGNCLVADISNNYYLNGTTATKVTLDNCTSISHDGKCSFCNKNYYVDSTTGKCVAVPTANLITNCVYYSTSTACALCATDYFLTANSCVAVETKITNCLYYSGASSCTYCNDGYLLSLDATTCVAAPTTSNCGDYTFVKCNTCESGYVLNPNNYFEGALVASSSSDKNLLASFAYDLQDNTESLIGQYACQTESTTNCSTFDEGTNTCTACLFGWYLDSSAVCIAYPDEPIYECQHYSSVSTCIQCNSNFYFKSGVCTQITDNAVIANCASYNSAANSVQCTACSANYYLSNNSCTARDKSADNKIANCATKATSADKCSICSSGYYLTNDGLECIAFIANCTAYNSIASGQTLACNSCDSGYYLNTTNSGSGTVTECLAGNIEFCDEYNNNNADSCILCQNGYLLQSNECFAHNNISNCTVYSTSTLHTCETCTETTHYNFEIESTCQNIASGSLISNCATYSGDLDNITCASCNSGYYLTSNSCAELTISNCNEMDGADCVSCKQSYALNYDSNSCIKTFGYMSDQCSKDSTIDDENTELARSISCDYCKEHAIPYDFEDHFVCMSKTEIRELAETTDDSKIITNCIKYDENIECIQCDISSNTPYLDTSGATPTCVDACDSYYVKYTLDEHNQLSQFYVCDLAGVTTVPNCLVYAPDLSDDGAYICIQCESDMITVVDKSESSYTNVDPSATAFQNFFPSPHAKYPKVSCFANGVSVMIAGVANQSLTSNCAYYHEYDTDEYGCIKCNQGYTGTINNDNYISACTRDSNCTTDKLYHLNNNINILASCHKCVSSSNIPFVAITSSANTDPIFNGFAEYTVTITDGDTDFANAAGSQKNIACRSNSRTTFNIASDSYKIPTNCGIGVILVNTNGTSDGTTTFGNYCAACKPGYRDEETLSGGIVKTTCTEIPNCASNSSFFNACSDCNTGYILEYDEGDDYIYYDKCLAVPTALATKLANCYAAIKNDSNANNAATCQVCKRGYTLNADKYCESIKPYQCETNNFRFSTQVNTDHWEWILYLQSTGVGCHECASTYYAVKIAESRDVCLASSWVNTYVDTITSIDDTEYIPHCKFYDANSGSTNCVECDANYVLSGSAAYTVTGDQCYINTSISNCVVASSATTCLRCVSNIYSLRNNKCEAGAISNCIAYNFDTNDTTVKCTQCAADYYLDTANNTCKLGYIHNCDYLENDNPQGCNSCKDGFVRITNIKDDYDYCYPLDSSLGCSVMTLTNSDIGGSLTCTACTNNGIQLPGSILSTENQTICLPFYQIPNCKTFDVDSTLNSSNFNCIECNSGYYLSSNNRCIARVYQPSKCTSYSTTEDKCIECDNTSYLSNNAKECTDYPKGILGCLIYSDENTCTSCKTGRYLDSNTCPTVSTAITNCSYYSANNVCSACATTYVLLNNTCIKATASNCATYTSETACATCPSGYVLETTSNITNCVTKIKTGCVLLDINSPYNCLECTGTYYLENGECKSPTTIANCAAYDSKTTCSLCNQGYALSANKDSCINTGLTGTYIDSLCVDSQVVSTPVCSRCDVGYYFVNGACTGTCNSSTSTGCLACNPDTPTTCYICKSGYYQDTAGKCNAIVTDNSSTMIMGIMTLLIAMISTML